MNKLEQSKTLDEQIAYFLQRKAMQYPKLFSASRKTRFKVLHTAR